MIGAGNTLGRGGNQKFTGRSRQDAAFMNRWVALEWAHDDRLEDAICGVEACDTAREWVETVRKFRRAVDQERISDVNLTTRESIKGIVALKTGVPMDMVQTMILRQGLEDQQWKRLVAAAK